MKLIFPCDRCPYRGANANFLRGGCVHVTGFSSRCTDSANQLLGPLAPQITWKQDLLLTFHAKLLLHRYLVFFLNRKKEDSSLPWK